ncbi:MAG: glutamate--cysteine ligase [Leptospira sp.]|nr:glutamate--cysteine ligase [Leptospira sp.]
MIEDFIRTKSNSGFLCKTIMGLERETMRINANGDLSNSPHPIEIGAPLTHPFIKTDFCESQVEYATMASYRMDSVMKSLAQLHNFTANNIKTETLWPFSMPPRLPSDEQNIPLAQYGNTDDAIIKTIYRRGLGLRYGRKMQTISGVHINISFSKYMMDWAAKKRHNKKLNKNIQSELYMDTIRNFSRYSFLLIYLFGASPVMDKTFCPPMPRLKELDPDTWYSENATSLRLSELGYTSQVQNQLSMSFNSLDEYIKSLCYAINTVYEPYSKFSNKTSISERNQLNDFYLQIENEYYSLIRPKQVSKNGERPIDSLSSRGIRYLEIRCVDSDPFHPLGVSEETIAFNQIFLLWCLLKSSPHMNNAEKKNWDSNQERVVWEGLNVQSQYNVLGEEKTIQEWWKTIYPELLKIALFWDEKESCRFHISSLYQEALEKQNQKIINPQLTASYKILHALKTTNKSFLNYGLELSQFYSTNWKKSALDPKTIKKLTQAVEKSLKEKENLEKSLQSKEYGDHLTIPAFSCEGA